MCLFFFPFLFLCVAHAWGQAKHGGMRSADFTSVKSSGKGGFTSANQNGTKAKSKK